MPQVDSFDGGDGCDLGTKLGHRAVDRMLLGRRGVCGGWAGICGWRWEG